MRAYMDSKLTNPINEYHPRESLKFKNTNKKVEDCYNLIEKISRQIKVHSINISTLQNGLEKLIDEMSGAQKAEQRMMNKFSSLDIPVCIKNEIIMQISEFCNQDPHSIIEKEKEKTQEIIDTYHLSNYMDKNKK